MGLINRIKSWVASEVLEPADLNNEFDNILNLVNGNIESANITDGTIVVADLANNAVETAKIKDLNVTTDKLAADAVTNPKVADDAIQAENINGCTGSGAVDIDNVPDGTRQAVDSSATSDNITHAATTHTKSVWAAFAMTTDGEANPLSISSEYAHPAAADGATDTAQISLDLPHGAIVTRFKIIGVTDATYGAIGANLIRKTHDNGSGVMATVDATAGASSDEDSSISLATVDNTTYAYSINLYADVDSGGGVAADDAKIYKFEVDYTTVNLKQL